MPSLDVRTLPKHVQDIIELKEITDATFSKFVDDDQTDIFWDILNQRRNNPEHSIILSIFGSQGSGKSLSAISMACYLDPAFNANRIFFNYQSLVNARSSLPDGCTVIVDEQSQVFGLDAHRVMVILANLKEQLRKRGISFIFCSPVLYDESRSSMYLVETVFIDEEEREAVAAWKLREGLTLGHIRIPHPLKAIDERGGLASQELLDVYQRKKDEHLERVLGRQEKDVFEEHAESVMKHPLFVQAEKVYLRNYRYIPLSSLQHIINKIFPEFGAGVVTGEVAGRIKVTKELSGEWLISGHSTKRKLVKGRR